MAPSPAKPSPIKLPEEESTPLKSSSATLLDQKVKDRGKLGKKERPDSAPLKREDARRQMPLDVNVVIQSNEPAGRYIFL